MIYTDIRNYLGKQNFAAVSTIANAMDILHNRAGEENIFCVLLDSTRGRIFTKAFVENIAGQLAGNAAQENILFILVTSFPERDKELARIPGLNLWLVSEFTQQLFIYETQPDDFYGLKSGVIGAISETPSSKINMAVRAKNLPWVTVILILINVVAFIVLSLNGNTESASYMLSKGAAYGTYIFEGHQFYRLITSMFMHFGMMHLMSNMVYLVLIGFTVEKETGHLRFALIYMLSGFAASLISAAYYYLSGQDVVSAGASGAIYGLIGLVVFMTFRNRGRMSRSNMWFRISAVLIFIFISNFLNNKVDAVAHAAGFIFGILLSLLIGTSKTAGKRKINKKLTGGKK